MRKNKIKFGIMQGRLTRPENEVLQFFPEASWKSEFDTAAFLDFDALQGVIDTDPLIHTLLKKENVNEIQKAADKSGVEFTSLCLHAFVTQNWWEYPSLEKLFVRMRQNGFNQYIIPLEGVSKESFKKNELYYKKKIQQVDSLLRNQKQLLLLETDNLDFWLPILQKVKVAHIGLNIDSGNLTHTYSNMLWQKLRAVKPYIRGAHLKDKNAKGQNVRFGTGNVDFNKFMRFVKTLNQNVTCIFESYRGPNDNPLNEARHNLQFIKTFYE